MNDGPALRKGIRRLLATLPGLALFFSLFSLTPAGGALAQYIPPPPSQTYAPAQGASAPASEEPRAKRAAPRRHKSARARQREVEAAQQVEPAEPRKARYSARRSRAEARAAARQARAEARAEARAASLRKNSRKTGAAAAPDEDDEPQAPPQAREGLTILAGPPQTTLARGAQELADLMKAANIDAKAKTGPISLAQLSEPDGGGADLAILQSDALEEARRGDGGAGLQRKLTFIARLFNQEIHIVARPGVKSFAELDGRTIAAGAPDTPEGRTAAQLFARAGLRPRLLEMDSADALARLGRGEIDAAIFIGGKPAPALSGLAIAGLHLLSIPYKGALQDYYYPAQITRADYPGLVANGAGVETVAIGTVLVALDAKPGTPRYKKLTQFTQTFFERFGALRDDAHHPKWREVNLAADVPGWRRFQPAQKWLDAAPAPRVSSMK